MTRSFALCAAITVFISLQSISRAEEAIRLKPDEIQAAREIREAEKERWKAKHGKNPIFVPSKTPLAYNCTNTNEHTIRHMQFVEKVWARPDVNFVTSSGMPAFRTSEEYFDWGVRLTIFDCNNKPMATIKEQLVHSFTHTPQVDYVVELPDGTEIARSMQASMVSDKFLIFDTQAESLAQAEGGKPEPLAYARHVSEWRLEQIDKSDKMAQSFCFGTNWRLNINEFAKGFWADPRSREVLMVMTTVKSIRDVSRDKDGRVTEERCSEPFWLSVLILPLIFLSVVLCFCWCPPSVCNVVCGCFKRMKYHPV